MTHTENTQPYPQQTDGQLLSDDRIEGYLVHDIEAFVGTNGHLYVNKFRAVTEGKQTFHLISGLFTGIWLACRRMWKLLPFYLLFTQMITSLCLMVEITFMKLFINIPSISYILTGLIGVVQALCFLLVGLWGYKLYWLYTKQHLDRFNCKHRPPVLDLELREKLTRAGGCSYICIIGGVLFNILNNYVSQYVGQLLITLFY